MRQLLPALGVCVIWAMTAPAYADPKSNDVYVTVLAGEQQWLKQAQAMAVRLDHENGLRILPVAGAGSLQAISDLSQIPNLDAVIISSDSLAYAKLQGLMNEKDSSVSYIARLAPLEVILVARKDVKNVTALAGKHIATGPAESASFATGELLFNALELPFTRVPQTGDAAVAALLNGKADAALFLGANLPKSALSSDRFHILALPMSPNLKDIYQPAMLTNQLLPGLVPKGGSVETVAAALTLAVHNWPRGSARSATLKIFEAELFKAQGDGVWDNLAAKVPGWTRHSTAQDFLNLTKSDQSLITPTGGEP